MGFNNPPVSWSRLERALSGKPADGDGVIYDPITIDHGDGGDTPAWTRKRPRYEAPEFVRQKSTVDYAELHCHSNFSFLDGASHPEELVQEAVRLGLTGLAMTDHDGFYGVVRFAEAGLELGLPTVFGAELSLDLPTPQNGEPDPVGAHLLALARGPEGYARLSRVIAEAQLAGQEKGRPVYDLDHVAARPGRPRRGAHRLPQGHCAPGPAHRRSLRRSPGAGPADHPVRRRARGGGADRPRPPRR